MNYFNKFKIQLNIIINIKILIIMKNKNIKNKTFKTKAKNILSNKNNNKNKNINSPVKSNTELETNKNQKKIPKDTLIQEYENSNNKKIKSEIAQFILIDSEIKKLQPTYDELYIKMKEDEKIINDLNKELGNLKSKYKYSPYLLGIEEFINIFFKQNNIKYKPKKLIFKNNLVNIEKIYNILGHETYLKMLRLYEKYCLFGKSFTNYKMDYSQLVEMFLQNKFYEITLPKCDIEVIFKKIKMSRGENKEVNFEDFLYIFIEIAKYLYEWEDNEYIRVKYLINNNLDLSCLKKTLKDKKFERWYYLLETREIRNVIKKYLDKLYSIFNKYARDTCYIKIENFINICQEMSLIPIFQSTKEMVEIVSNTNYKKLFMNPTTEINFITFVEVICIASLFSYDQYFENLKKNNRKNKNIKKREKKDEVYEKEFSENEKVNIDSDEAMYSDNENINVKTNENKNNTENLDKNKEIKENNNNNNEENKKNLEIEEDKKSKESDESIEIKIKLDVKNIKTKEKMGYIEEVENEDDNEVNSNGKNSQKENQNNSKNNNLNIEENNNENKNNNKKPLSSEEIQKEITKILEIKNKIKKEENEKDKRYLLRKASNKIFNSLHSSNEFFGKKFLTSKERLDLFLSFLTKK